MTASFCGVNLKGMLGLLSAVLRCCFPERLAEAVPRFCQSFYSDHGASVLGRS